MDIIEMDVNGLPGPVGAGAGMLFKQALGLGGSLTHQGFRVRRWPGLLLLGFLALALAPVGIGVVTLVLPLTTAPVIFSAVIVAVVLMGGVVLGTQSSGPRGDSSISTSS